MQGEKPLPKRYIQYLFNFYSKTNYSVDHTISASERLMNSHYLAWCDITQGRKPSTIASLNFEIIYPFQASISTLYPLNYKTFGFLEFPRGMSWEDCLNLLKQFLNSNIVNYIKKKISIL